MMSIYIWAIQDQEDVTLIKYHSFILSDLSKIMLLLLVFLLFSFEDVIETGSVVIETETDDILIKHLSLILSNLSKILQCSYCDFLFVFH